MDLGMSFKTFFETIYYVAAAVAAVGALIVYWRNSRLERARWLTSLYEKFYEREALKKVRTILDGDDNCEAVNRMVENPRGDFTDYLNFFEYVGILSRLGQLDYEEIEMLFDCYLYDLKRHTLVWKFVCDKDNGYEELKHLLLRRGA